MKSGVLAGLCLSVAMGMSAGARAATHGAAMLHGVSETSYGWDMFGGASSDAMIRAMKADGATMLVFTVSSDVNTRTNVITPEWSEPNAHLAHAIATAQQAGLQVGLKLEYLTNGNTLASAGFDPASPSAFFASYRANVLGWAQYARAYGMSLMVIGTEMGGYLTGTSANLPAWTDIISGVRARFAGKVTYAAGAGVLPGRYYTRKTPDWSWEYDEAYRVTFWRQLDYVGLDAYPVFSTPGGTARTVPTEAQLATTLRAAPDTIDHSGNTFDWMAHWNGEIAAAGRPGLITEVGSASVATALACPGCWLGNGPVPDQAAQAEVYRAMLSALDGDKSIAGILVYANNAYQDNGYATGFSFYGKQAEGVLRSLWTLR